MDLIYLRKRIAAAAIDGILALILYFATYLTLNGLEVQYAHWIAVLNYFLLNCIVVVFIWPGQSIGKKMIKIRVISLSGNSDNKPMLFIRELCKFILLVDTNWMAGIVLLGFLIINPNNQALYDLFSKTKVVDLAAEKVMVKP